MVAFFVGILLAAFTQEQGSYWALTFTSLIVVNFGPGEYRIVHSKTLTFARFELRDRSTHRVQFSTL